MIMNIIATIIMSIWLGCALMDVVNDPWNVSGAKGNLLLFVVSLTVVIIALWI